MQKKLWLILCLFSLFIFVSCRTTSRQISYENKSLFLTDDHIVNILPAKDFKENLELMQIIDGEYNGQKYLIQTIVLLNSTEISVIAFSALGNTIYDLQYKNDDIIYNTVIDATGKSAAYMVADIQFCYYPVEKIREMLEDAGLILDSYKNDRGWVRKIYNGDEEIISIKREGNFIEYNNLLRNYKYSIEEI
ncbi:MAG: DUF3261 domain-containing protein [Spirochaetaceae bacterium]|jgi:hypothetical protein|nr:DUF3261 domain-containing protein [Spirochaetaceae bacterium]